MSSSTSTVRGIKRLSELLTQLNAKPRLALTGLKSLKLSYAARNDHFGARHFAKEDLPRIQYANPDLDIRIETLEKTKEQNWRPEMQIEFSDGRSQTLSMESKWSSAILEELMTVAGGKDWQAHVRECKEKGVPAVPQPEKRLPTPTAELPGLNEFRAKLGSDARLPKTKNQLKLEKRAQEKAAKADSPQATAA